MTLPLHYPFGSVLIDNSVYFAAKEALQGRLDAWNLYNLANFLQHVVFAEEIHLSPTHHSDWPPNKPDETDHLLLELPDNADGWNLVVPHDILTFEDNDLEKFFRKIVSECNDDLKLLKGLSKDRVVAARHVVPSAVTKVLNEYTKRIEKNVKDFAMGDFSKAFDWNRQSAALTESENIEDDPGRGVANYLLRSEGACLLSKVFPYSPHSQRLDFVNAKYKAGHQQIVEDILRTAENELAAIDTDHNDARNSPHQDPQDRLLLPLVLVVLLCQDIKEPMDLLHRAWDYRNQQHIRSFREWSIKVEKKRQEGSRYEAFEASRELEEVLAAVRLLVEAEVRHVQPLVHLVSPCFPILISGVSEYFTSWLPWNTARANGVTTSFRDKCAEIVKQWKGSRIEEPRLVVNYLVGDVWIDPQAGAPRALIDDIFGDNKLEDDDYCLLADLYRIRPDRK